MTENNEVVYVAELDADVDDVIAAEYLHNKGVLKCIVLDPLPKTAEGRARQKSLEQLGIQISKSIPPIAKYVFVGGALTEVARFIKMNSINTLVMNGGFVGRNIVPADEQLDKFKGKKYVRTFNFNCNIKATEEVLQSTDKQIGKIILVGKNVCHSRKNTELELWNDTESKALFRKYNVRNDKLQHDMLACHEGLAMLGLGNVTNAFCKYLEVKPINEGIDGKYTEWGSSRVEPHEFKYRSVISAIGWA